MHRGMQHASQHASQLDAPGNVLSSKDLMGFTPSSVDTVTNTNIIGLEVFVPKNFFPTELLPKEHKGMLGCVPCNRAAIRPRLASRFALASPRKSFLVLALHRRFIAKVKGLKKADKPAMDILFQDGAVVPIYILEHKKAKSAIKHVHLSNPAVMFKFASSSSSPGASSSTSKVY